MPQRIFISYRRDDAASDAGRLADHLQRRFGADRVFLDVEAIEPGTDFVEVLQEFGGPLPSEGGGDLAVMSDHDFSGLALFEGESVRLCHG